MANLNENILCHIFDYLSTPLEWIRVSQVCKLWKQAASKHWKRIQEINYLPKYLEKKLKPGDAENAPLISAEDCDSIVCYTAPFIKTLIGCSITDEIETLIMFGSFLYKVKYFDTVEILTKNILSKLLENKATGITEIHFDKQPFAELGDLWGSQGELSLKELFKINKIKKVTFEECRDFYTYMSTDDIEELTIGFDDGYEIPSFEGYFSNLKTLNFNFYGAPTELHKVLSKLLPHIPGVTTLRLHYQGQKTRTMTCKAFMDVGKLPQLEHLTINTNFAFNIEASNFFLATLVKGCPKLRSVELFDMRISGNQLRTLLGLPLLEKLTAHRVSNFDFLIDLPELPNLHELEMIYNVEKCDPTVFGKVLKSMPNLRILKMKVDFLARTTHRKLIGKQTLQLVSQIATVTASQNKDVVVEDSDTHENQNCMTIKLFRRDVLDADGRKLTVQVSLRSEGAFVERLHAFVQETLENHYEMEVDD